MCPRVLILMAEVAKRIGNIDGGEDALVQQKPVGRVAAIDVGAHDLATVVDADDLGGQGTRELDGREIAFGQQEPKGRWWGSRPGWWSPRSGHGC